MSFTVHAVDQRSDDWRMLRAGLLTGSCAADILAERKRGTGELQRRKDLRKRLVCERLTGIPEEESDYKPKDMRHGIDLEPIAFSAYEARTGQVARRVGFIKHTALQAGCSPDGYVGDLLTGLIELKCPKSTTHLEYLQADCVPEEYWPQIVHALWLTGAAWCDFCSFDDRFLNRDLQLFRKRVKSEDVDLVAYELVVVTFLREVQDEYDALRVKFGEVVAA